MDEVAAFYDSFADDYPSLFADWDASVAWQGGLIDGLIRDIRPDGPLLVLDATCGIGTQAIGLALRGYRVTATDLSAASIGRARREAARLGATVDFGVADVRELRSIGGATFDVAISFDNALPHLLDPDDLGAALRRLHQALVPHGLLLASIRDYDALLVTRPRGEPARLTGRPGGRRLVAQAWEWDADEPVYRLHQFVLREQPDGEWSAGHYETRYRALRRRELEAAAARAGFEDIRWLEPAESGFYQPILAARRGLPDPP